MFRRAGCGKHLADGEQILFCVPEGATECFGRRNTQCQSILLSQLEEELDSQAWKFLTLVVSQVRGATEERSV